MKTVMSNQEPQITPATIIDIKCQRQTMDTKLLHFRDALARTDIRAATEMIEKDRGLLDSRLSGNVTPIWSKNSAHP
jgi:hypothetical protein